MNTSLVDSEHFGRSFISKKEAHTYTIMKGGPLSYKPPILAKLEGVCKQYGFKRKFVARKYFSVIDGNFQHTRFDLTDFGLYEYRSFLVHNDPILLRSGFIFILHSGVRECDYYEVKDFFSVNGEGEDAPF